MKIVIIFLIFSLTIYPQKDSAFSKFHNDFSIFIQTVDINEDCKIVKKQLSNAYLMALERNMRTLRPYIDSENDLVNLFYNFSLYFVEHKPELTTYILSCDNADSFELFGSKLLGGILKEYALYYNPINFINNYGSFDLLITINTNIDSVDSAFYNWSKEKVIVKPDPIDYKVGIFHDQKNEYLNYSLLRLTDYQYEFANFINDTSKWEVKWINDYEYDLIFIENSNTADVFKPGDIAACRITEVTNTYYSVIVKTKYGITNSKMYKINY